MSVQFEWDSKKAKANLTKHGVSFEEAMTSDDEWAEIICASVVRRSAELFSTC